METLNLKFHRVTDTAPIEGLTNLRALNLGENPITALRLDQLGQLTDLRLYGTGISELNLSKTPEMTVLYLQRTALTDLDLSVLPKLEKRLHKRSPTDLPACQSGSTTSSGWMP